MDINDIHLIVNSFKYYDLHFNKKDYKLNKIMANVNKKLDFILGAMTFIYKDDEYKVYYKNFDVNDLYDLFYNYSALDNTKYIAFYLDEKYIIRENSIDKLIKLADLDFKTIHLYSLETNAYEIFYGEIEDVYKHARLKLPMKINLTHITHLYVNNIDGEYKIYDPNNIITKEDQQIIKEIKLMSII